MLSLINPNQETRGSTYLRVDGSYMKFKNATLSYTLPQTLTQRILVNRARVYLNAENFLLIANRGEGGYVGPDPEVPGANYPLPVSFSLGLNLTF